VRETFARGGRECGSDILLRSVQCTVFTTNAVLSNPKHALECVVQSEKDVFPAVCIAYRLLLTIGFSIASCEKSFSKLKLMKICLRSSIFQERLTTLTGFNQYWKRIRFSRCKKWGSL